MISEGAEGIILESAPEGYAEYFSADLSEKAVRGMTENALKCVINGGTIPMSRIIDREQHFQPDPLTAPMVLDAFKRYDEGATMKAVRDWLNNRGFGREKFGFGCIRCTIQNRSGCKTWTVSFCLFSTETGPSLGRLK